LWLRISLITSEIWTVVWRFTIRPCWAIRWTLNFVGFWGGHHVRIAKNFRVEYWMFVVCFAN
jgi:hypothetical protein